jgi:hypothetical protein
LILEPDHWEAASVPPCSLKAVPHTRRQLRRWGGAGEIRHKKLSEWAWQLLPSTLVREVLDHVFARLVAIASEVFRTPSTICRWRTTRHPRLARPYPALPRFTGRVAQLRPKRCGKVLSPKSGRSGAPSCGCLLSSRPPRRVRAGAPGYPNLWQH